MMSPARIFLGCVALVSFLAGLLSISLANRKAKEPLAPPTSFVDYLAVFLMILGAVLALVAAKL
jgi:hypothetical protein